MKVVEDHEKNKMIKELEENEVKRRQHFNMKLLGIQEQVKEILREEENQRISFLEEVVAQ
jgi:hypothetical protein